MLLDGPMDGEVFRAWCEQMLAPALRPSPDLNPIENAFAKLKAHVRKAAARTIEALERAAAQALQTFKPFECTNFFLNAGYGRD